VFYPEDVPQRRWLEFYADRFCSVEINATFYRLPAATTFGGWASRVPGEFRFGVKVSRYLTHIRRLRDVEEGLARLIAACAPLGSNHGPLLVQLPPHFDPAPDLLDRFLAECPLTIPIAVEFRDPAWFIPEIERRLRGREAALVWSDYPGLSTPEWITAPFLYVRRHGSGPGYAGRYRRAALRDLAARLASFDGDVFCYFNNDAAGAAVEDAAELAGLLGA
jgi:uncharacterized protein YecE (DUF72 family)